MRRGRVPLADATAVAADLPTIEKSATARALAGGKRPWTEGEYLLADVWSALTGTKHPRWPTASTGRRTAERERALERAQARAADRRRLIAEGSIT